MIEKSVNSNKPRNFIYDKDNIEFDLSKYHVEKTPSTNINGILDLKYNLNEDLNAGNNSKQKKIHRNPSK